MEFPFEVVSLENQLIQADNVDIDSLGINIGAEMRDSREPASPFIAFTIDNNWATLVALFS
jgi:hypothetical protein